MQIQGRAGDGGENGDLGAGDLRAPGRQRREWRFKGAERRRFFWRFKDARAVCPSLAYAVGRKARGGA